MIVPPVNTKGIFIFKEPFDNKLYNNQEYTVTSIRSLLEIYNSEEKPYETIYVPVGLSDIDFKNDLDNNVPIVVLTTTGNEYFYVPANKILSMPQIAGVKYQDTILAIGLGQLPLSYDFTLVKDTVKQTVYDVIGVDSTVEVVLASAVILKTYEDDILHRTLLDNRKIVIKSYRTKYLELLEQYNKQVYLNEQLQQCIKTKLDN